MENNEKSNLLFSFTSLNIKEKEIDFSDLLYVVADQLKIILNREFSENGKREMKDHPDRLQFACPYCRDSATDPWKKRGNLYKNDMEFHCYNCGIHTSAEEMLKDFDADIDNDSRIALHNISKNAKKNYQLKIGNLSDLYIFDKYVKYAQDLKSFKTLFGLKDIVNSGPMIREYLEKRDQKSWGRMAWDPDTEQLYIFNMVDDTKFIAYQTRQFKRYSKQKYLTYNLDHVYSEMFLTAPKEDEDFIEANRLSTFFGLFTVDFNRPISVFEGPLDSFLRKNAVATCSIHKEFPIDIPVQWLFDSDSEGRKKSVIKIQAGEEVFLWSKFITEFNIKLNRSKKIDYNDLFSYLLKNNLQTSLLYKPEFFSSSKYDIYEI